MHITKHLPARPDVVEKEDLVREALTQKPSVEENIYTCSVCSRTFRTKPFLRRHILTHGEKKFLCSECGKCFVTKAGLESHLKVILVLNGILLFVLMFIKITYVYFSVKNFCASKTMKISFEID